MDVVLTSLGMQTLILRQRIKEIRLTLNYLNTEIKNLNLEITVNREFLK